MTGKRFTWNSKDVVIDDTVTGNQLEVIDITEIDVLLEVLNNLYEENQSSKEFIEQLQEELVLFKKAGADMGNDLNAQIITLKQENEQLKEILHFLRNDNAEDILNVLNTQQNEIVRLMEENEHLKKELNSFKPIIFEDTNNGGSSILYEKVVE